VVHLNLTCIHCLQYCFSLNISSFNKTSNNIFTSCLRCINKFIYYTFIKLSDSLYCFLNTHILTTSKLSDTQINVYIIQIMIN